MHMQLTHHARMRAPVNGIQQAGHSAPSVFSAKSAGGKQSLKGPSQENFQAIGGYFKCYPYCVTVLGWLKKKK